VQTHLFGGGFVRTHQEVDKRSLALHRLVAEKFAATPN